MRVKILPWLGREFIEISCEGNAEGTAAEETQEFFRRFDVELEGMGLSLENTVRTRLWGRDRQSRDLGNGQRVMVLSGKARSASSSYIAPDHFESDAKVSLDLVAMRPVRPERRWAPPPGQSTRFPTVIDSVSSREYTQSTPQRAVSLAFCVQSWPQ